MFSRKFWNRIDFKSVEEIDEKIEWFNSSSQKYLHYQKPKTKSKPKKDFIPKIYFIRQVKEDKEQIRKAFIDVSNQRVFLPQSYINYFTFIEWNLKQEILCVYFEKEQKSKIIKKVS